MKKYFIKPGIIGVACLLLFSMKGTAQYERKLLSPGEKEKMETFKIAYLTRELSLTSDEAKVFWPVYDEYSKELEVLRDSKMKQRNDAMRNFDQLTSNELERLVDDEIISRQQELDIQKKYHVKFKSTLPVQKVARLYIAEQNFKRKLLEKMRENRQGDHPNKQDDMR